jgi:hypothetical protein
VGKSKIEIFPTNPRDLHIISTDEDPGLRIESFAVINLRGVSTNKTIIYFIAMQTYKELFMEPNISMTRLRNNVCALRPPTLVPSIQCSVQVLFASPAP